MIKMVYLQFITYYYVYVKSIIDQFSSTIRNINVSTVIKKKKMIFKITIYCYFNSLNCKVKNIYFFIFLNKDKVNFKYLYFYLSLYPS